MVRINLKGIHRVKKKNKSGIVEYHYAWRGGPCFWKSTDKYGPGSAPYIQALTLVIEEASPSKGKFREVIRSYLESREFKALAPRTRKDIMQSVSHERGIDAKYGDAPIRAFDLPGIRTSALNWRDTWAGRTADHRIAHLAQIVRWANNRNILVHHHLTNISKIHKSNRSEVIWKDAEIDRFVAGSPDYIGRILVAATETGLRPGDLLGLSKNHVERTLHGRRLFIRTRKRERFASIPVTDRMGVLIDTTPKNQLLLLPASSGKPWKHSDQMGKAVSKWRDKLGIRSELRLYDARGTAATRLFEADATLQEIAVHMGWSVQHAAKMVEVYVALNPDASDSVLLKLERHKSK